MGSPHLKPVVFAVGRLAPGASVSQFGQSVTVSSPAFLVLIHGGRTVVDEDNLNLLLARRWNLKRYRKTGYVVYNGRTENLRLHNLILPSSGNRTCDHINGVGWDNRKSNLRYSDSYGQARNHRPTAGKLFSAYKGVTYDHKKRLFRARIMVNRRSIGLGRYKDEVDAATAYDEAALKYFGEFAILNFSPKSCD